MKLHLMSLDLHLSNRQTFKSAKIAAAMIQLIVTSIAMSLACKLGSSGLLHQNASRKLSLASVRGPGRTDSTKPLGHLYVYVLKKIHAELGQSRCDKRVGCSKHQSEQLRQA
jgi:hypothetical protein